MASTILSGTYNSATGVLTLTLAAPASFAAGNFVTLTNLTGQGTAALNGGTFTAIAPTSGATVTLQAPIDLGTIILTGGNADFANIVLFEQGGEQQLKPASQRRQSGAIFAADQGNEGVYFGGPPEANVKWDPVQNFQPPRFRYAQRAAALLAPDTSFDDTSPLKVQFARGWEVQNVQPPSPMGPNRGRQPAAALMRGDDGIQYIFIPPFGQAPRASNFPNMQSNPFAAIPTYDAGPQPGAISTRPNITGATILKAAPGSLIAISVTTAGTTVGGLYDTPILGGAIAQNLVWSIPNTAGVYVLDWPMQTGIVIVPGTGQVLAAKWT